MALSDLRIGTSLPGGHLNTLGGPVDPFYAQTDGTSWSSLAAACAAVPTAFRKTRTVNVLDQEYWWLESDLSDNGLVRKSIPGGGSGGGSSAIYADYSFPVETDGAQSFQLPAGTLGLDGVPQVYQGDNGLIRPLGNWDFTNNTLTISADSSLLAGDIVVGRRVYGSDPAAGDSDTIDASQITGVLSASQLPPLTDSDIAQLFELLKPYLDQRYTQI